jgi:hypothetical protein
MPHFRIEDSRQGYEFDGELIADVDTRQLGVKDFMDRPRYLRLQLYRTDSGSYVVWRTNGSRVFHDPGATCARGEQRNPEDLPESAVPCNEAPVRSGRPVCYPRLDQYAALKRPVMLETNQYTVGQCPDAGTTIKWLTTAHHRSGPTTHVVSRPVEELLRQAAQVDPAFRQDGSQPKPTVKIA